MVESKGRCDDEVPEMSVDKRRFKTKLAPLLVKTEFGLVIMDGSYATDYPFKRGSNIKSKTVGNLFVTITWSGRMMSIATAKVA